MGRWGGSRGRLGCLKVGCEVGGFFAFLLDGGLGLYIFSAGVCIGMEFF